MNAHYLFHLGPIARHASNVSDRGKKEIGLATGGGYGEHALSSAAVARAVRATTASFMVPPPRNLGSGGLVKVKMLLTALGSLG